MMRATVPFWWFIYFIRFSKTVYIQKCEDEHALLLSSFLMYFFFFFLLYPFDEFI